MWCFYADQANNVHVRIEQCKDWSTPEQSCVTYAKSAHAKFPAKLGEIGQKMDPPFVKFPANASANLKKERPFLNFGGLGQYFIRPILPGYTVFGVSAAD